MGSGGLRLISLPESGGLLPIVRGSQGGIHVVVGAWVRDLPLEMELAYELRDAEDSSPVGLSTVLELTPSLFSADGSRYQRHPDLLVLDNEMADVTPFVGRAVYLQGRARAGSEEACDSRLVTLTDPG